MTIHRHPSQFPTDLTRLLDPFESTAHRCIVDAQIRSDLIEPIALFIGFGYPFLATVREYPPERRLGSCELRPRDFLTPILSSSMLLYECFAPQVDLNPFFAM